MLRDGRDAQIGIGVVLGHIGHDDAELILVALRLCAAQPALDGIEAEATDDAHLLGDVVALPHLRGNADQIALRLHGGRQAAVQLDEQVADGGEPELNGLRVAGRKEHGEPALKLRRIAALERGEHRPEFHIRIDGRLPDAGSNALVADGLPGAVYEPVARGDVRIAHAFGDFCGHGRVGADADGQADAILRVLQDISPGHIAAVFA